MDNLKKKKSIHELAKANPNKAYSELEQEEQNKLLMRILVGWL